METLAARVEKLESANRRRKSSSAIVLVFVVTICSLAPRHAERFAAVARADRIERDVLHACSVEAQDFVLKEGDGRVNARLGLTPRIGGKLSSGPNGPLYLIPRDGALPGQAVLDFYNEKGDVVWTAPSTAQSIPAR